MILKIENVGDSVTLAITGAEVVAGKWPSVRFATDTGDDLYLPLATADRQLARLNLPLKQVAGKILTFSRAHNPTGKPFWNIALAGSLDDIVEKVAKTEAGPGLDDDLREKMTPTKPAKPTPTVTNVSELESTGGDTTLSAEAWTFLARVKEITAWYMTEITPLYVEVGIGCSPESCQAGIATILITLSQNRGR